MKEKKIYNYAKLKGRIKERCLTQADLGKAAGIGKSTLNLKISSKAEFNQGDIYRICETLDIKPEEISQYFFAV